MDVNKESRACALSGSRLPLFPSFPACDLFVFPSDEARGVVWLRFSCPFGIGRLIHVYVNLLTTSLPFTPELCERNRLTVSYSTLLSVFTGVTLRVRPWRSVMATLSWLWGSPRTKPPPCNVRKTINTQLPRFAFPPCGRFLYSTLYTTLMVLLHLRVGVCACIARSYGWWMMVVVVVTSELPREAWLCFYVGWTRGFRVITGGRVNASARRRRTARVLCPFLPDRQANYMLHARRRETSWE